MKARLLSVVAVLTTFLCGFSQQLSLTDFKETMEPDAVRYRVDDNNGVACALIKIGMIAKDPVFDGAVKSEYKDGEYWVYVPGGIDNILIKTSNFVPFVCKFNNPLQSLFTYRAIIEPASGGNGGVKSQAARPDGITIDVPGTSQSFFMVLVKPGMFEMGATEEQNSKEADEKPVHWVKISRPFYMGETEVTQALYEAVMGNNPSAFNDPEKPVDNVSWADAQRFINRLNSLTGRNFSLPTEAQWEYAARGGDKGRLMRYSGSNEPLDIAWFDGNAMNRPHAVKQLAPNELGIYDMSGNVWEMCQDYKQNYSKDEQTDPLQNKVSDNRVRRGGAWGSDSEQLRNAYRRRIPENERSKDTGFRLVLVE